MTGNGSTDARRSHGACVPAQQVQVLVFLPRRSRCAYLCAYESVFACSGGCK